MSISTNRRQWLTGTGAGLAFAAWAPAQEKLPAEKRKFGLGFSLYGMKTLPLAEALRVCREIGYECVELPVMADWPADSAKLTTAARTDFRAALAENRLRLSALMENLPLLGEESQHQKNLDRLKGAFALAHELAPQQPPVIETILGGAPAQWESEKPTFVRRLADWAKLAAEMKCTLAIKAHVNNALRRPADVLWLLKQVDNPSLRCAYDFSHLQLQGDDLRETLLALLSQTAFIHVKDAQGEPKKFQFLLPGAGSIDYAAYFRLLAEQKYAGDVVVEVSGMLHSQKDYDPRAAAKKSFLPLVAAVGALENSNG